MTGNPVPALRNERTSSFIWGHIRNYSMKSVINQICKSFCSCIGWWGKKTLTFAFKICPSLLWCFISFLTFNSLTLSNRVTVYPCQEGELFCVQVHGFFSSEICLIKAEIHNYGNVEMFSLINRCKMFWDPEVGSTLNVYSVFLSCAWYRCWRWCHKRGFPENFWNSCCKEPRSHSEIQSRNLTVSSSVVCGIE